MGLYLIIMGVQGAGKGVQAAHLKEAYDILHVSTGDLFRAMRTRTDDLAVRVQEIIKSGALVPDDVTNEVLQDRLEQPDAASGVIFDGYPRNIAQAEWLDAYLESRNESLTAVLLLDLDLYNSFKRAFGRVTSKTGESYNIYFKNDGLNVKPVDHPEKAFPPRIEATLETTGEELIRRADDANAASIIKRIDTYIEQTQPLIDYYEQKGLVRQIDANHSIAEVGEALKEAVDAATAG